ncbi:WLM-like protein [Artemisia annua]|uniref:WLM-like protein n=1 Tax=Artemisia annua TaxID=35608 RepID=A0A2U1NTV4_ARTAN|nr:WLM-like protein [Artemisia annua]
MQQRNSGNRRPSGTDGSDFSYRMVVDNRYTKVAKGKSTLSKVLGLQAVVLLVAVFPILLALLNKEPLETLSAASISIIFISIIIGEWGKATSRRLGGFTRQPPLSSLRQTALSAAENRVRLGTLLPTGPKRLGGDKSIMSALTPVQAAAMAAERRYQDDIWCGLEEIVDEEESGTGVPQERMGQDSKYAASSSGLSANTNAKSQKRSRQLDNGSNCCDGHPGSDFVDLTDAPSVSNSAVTNDVTANKRSRQTERGATRPSSCDLEKNCIDLTCDVSTSESASNTESSVWECMVCTLLNPSLAPICELCGTLKPKAVEDKYKTWSCKFCTLENIVKLEKCGACGQWRYSHGQPIGTPSPNVGT